MNTRLNSDEALVIRLLPHANADPEDRAVAWREWYDTVGAASVLSFVRMANDTPEPDADILQDAIATAYVEVERGGYERRAGIPFTAYVKGIARNKIREARRRARRTIPLDDMPPGLLESAEQPLERAIERREQLSRLRQCMTTLPHCRRKVMEAYLDGQSTGEIAQRLGISKDAVRQHKSRGMRNLRHRLL